MKTLSKLLLCWLLVLLILPLSAQIPAPKLKTKTSADLQELFHWKADRKPLVSAHRGGPSEGFPENCLETFEHTLSFGQAIIECDIVLSKDSQLVMMHDETLERTTTGTGKVSDYTLEELQKLQLKDNQGKVCPYRIPTLDQVLAWAKGKAILTLDIKKGVPAEMIVAKVREHKAESYALVITYNLEDAKKYYALDPDLMLSVSIRNLEELNAFRISGIPFSHIIVFMGVGKFDSATLEALHHEGVYCILGTMWRQDKEARESGSAQVFTDLIKAGIDIFATDEPRLAAEGIQRFMQEKRK